MQIHMLTHTHTHPQSALLATSVCMKLLCLFYIAIKATRVTDKLSSAACICASSPCAVCGRTHSHSNDRWVRRTISEQRKSRRLCEYVCPYMAHGGRAHIQVALLRLKLSYLFVFYYDFAKAPRCAHIVCSKIMPHCIASEDVSS